MGACVVPVPTSKVGDEAPEEIGFCREPSTKPLLAPAPTRITPPLAMTVSAPVVKILALRASVPSTVVLTV
jgi:hypothetical protein